jgi:hypothetical protein
MADSAPAPAGGRGGFRGGFGGGGGERGGRGGRGNLFYEDDLRKRWWL